VRALFCERAEDTRASSDDDDEDTLLKPQMTNQFSTRERSGKNSIEEVSVLVMKQRTRQNARREREREREREITKSNESSE